MIYLYRYEDEAEMYAVLPEMTGLPVTVHAALLWRQKKMLEEHGYTVVIEFKLNDPKRKLLN